MSQRYIFLLSDVTEIVNCQCYSANMAVKQEYVQTVTLTLTASKRLGS